jgi:hypothetical protein
VTTGHNQTVALVAAAFLMARVASAQPEIVQAAGAAAVARQLIEAHHSQSGEPVKCGLPALSAALRDRMLMQKPGGIDQVMARPAMQVSKSAGGFRVHYDTSGIDAAAMLDSLNRRIPGTADEYADSVLAILAYVHLLQTVQLGFAAPQADGGRGGSDEYDIYVMELGNLYGYTTPDTSIFPGDTVTSFVTIDNDFAFVTPSRNKGMPALRVTLAHEYQHSIQLGRYSYWFEDAYLYEISATWMEDVAYTDVNDYYNYMNATWGHFRNPQTLFLSGDNLIMYSRAIWGLFLEKRFGAGVMKRIWEYTRQSRPPEAMDKTLRERQSSLSAAFAEWALWNFFTGTRADTASYYPEGGAYPLIAQSRITFTPPSREMTDSLRSFAARYYEVYSPGDTSTIVAVNTDYSGGFESSPYQAYSVALSSTDPDGTYLRAGESLYARVRGEIPSDWSSWVIWDTTITGGARVSVPEATPFPNPFKPDGTNEVLIPLSATAEVKATLAIFSTSFERVAMIEGQSSSFNGTQVVRWNGKTDRGAMAGSGVYIFVVTLPDRTLTGKVAVVRP